MRKILFILGLLHITSSLFSQSPTINNFYPNTGNNGTKVTIQGTNFDSVTMVSFGGVPAKSFKLDSIGSLSAIVDTGASGNVVVTTKKGTGTKSGFLFGNVPVITSFSPLTGQGGTVVTITGTDFLGATAVRFGGIDAASYTVNSATSITAVLSASGGTGQVLVITPLGSNNFGSFKYIPPYIYNFSPKIGTNGSKVTIYGGNFDSVTAVTFGGVPAKSYTVDSVGYINAIVGTGTTGDVSVTTTKGTGSKSGFLYGSPPVISSFTPASGQSGTVVTITGSDFTGATVVKFGGINAASFTVNSSTSISATLGPDGGSGQVYIETNYGNGGYGNFNYVAPYISYFTPSSGTNGTKVIIRGVNFDSVSAVLFGGVPAKSFTIDSIGYISATVGTGATGSVVVTTSKGTATKSGFTFISSTAPLVNSFSPSSGTTGTNVRIVGTGFTGTTSVTFGGILAASYSVSSDSIINAVVGSGATGKIRVTNSANNDTSKTQFVFTVPQQGPLVKSFSPSSGSTGTTVRIVGSYFTGVNSVSFGNVQAASYSVVSDSIINAIVGSGATGKIKVSSVSNYDTSTTSFIYTPVIQTPIVNSFSPSSGTTGTSVRIVGTGFTGTSSVTFGGIQAASYIVSSDSIINAVVGSGATGKIKVTNSANNDTSKTQFVFTAPQQGPLVKSFSPSSGTTGTIVRIVGNYFTGATSVSFGSDRASSFTVLSDSVINATVAFGASGKIKVTNAINYDTTKTPFVYIPLPIINTSSDFKMFNSCYGQVSAPEFITVNGQNFISNLIIKAPAGVEISNATDTNYSSILSFAAQNGNIVNYGFSIRIKNKTSIGNYIDTIKIYDGNSLIKTINLDFKVVGYPTQPTITRNQNTLISSPSLFYKWIFNNSKILDSVGLVQIASKGIYRVEVSTNKLCWTASNDYIVQSDPTNNTLNDFEFVVFPNPVPSLFYVQLKLDKKYSGDLQVTISDIAGVPKLKINKYIYSSNYIKIPISQNLTKGTYSVQVKINGYQIKALQIIGL